MRGRLVLEDGAVCFTAPMVGNDGVAPGRSESARPHARAVLTCGARGPEWTDRLAEGGIVALTGIDMRSLVLRLREGGSMRGVAVTGDAPLEEALAAVRNEDAVSLQERHEVAARAS